MLIFAKKYDEEIIPGFINGIKKAYLEGDNDMAENIMKYELGDKYSEDIMNKIKKYVMEDIKDYTFQPIIRYGDSVIGDTPLLLKKDNQIFIDKIKNLSLLNESINLDGKIYNKINNIYTWTDNGWTEIINVMKHKLDVNKKLYRITTHSGSVVVTDDHSLLDNNGKEVTVKNLNIGDKLMHSFPTFENVKEYKLFSKTITNDMSRILGFLWEMDHVDIMKIVKNHHGV